MLKSNLEPKNKILNIYLNCQSRSTEPVPVPVQYPVTPTPETQTKTIKVKVRSEERIHLICDTLHSCTVNVINPIYQPSKLEILLPQKIFLSFP